MASERPLPTRRNHLLSENLPSFDELVSRRKLGQTKLDVKISAKVSSPSKPGFFDYAHLRAPLPKGIVSGVFRSSPPSYYLMRRSHDGYISATGMFKATFPWAKTEEEEAERLFLKSLPTTSPEETAGNIWVPPQQALSLAEEYGLRPWIEALLDPREIDAAPAEQGSPVKKVQPPPTFEAIKAAAPALAAPSLNAPVSFIPQPPQTPSTRTRSRRSVSPTKSTAKRAAVPASPMKRRTRSTSAEPESAEIVQKETTLVETVSVLPSVEEEPRPSVEDDEERPATATKKRGGGRKKRTAATPTPAPVTETEIVQEEVKIKIKQEVAPPATSQFQPSIPEAPSFASQGPPSRDETLQMIEEARQMVAASQREKEKSSVDEESSEKASAEGDSQLSQKVLPARPSKTKRKVEDMSVEDKPDEESREDTGDDDESEERSAKKAKTTDVEVRKNQVRRRAFFGISATVAAGAILPWLMGAM